MLVCEEINFELPPKIIVLNPKDGRFTKSRFSKRNDKSIIKEKGEKIKAENNPPGGLYEVYKINIMMSVLKV